MSRKVLIDDDAAQFESIMQRLRRLEQGVPEDIHFVGSSTEPQFQNSWRNYDAGARPANRAAGFYRDRGRVYLTGIIMSGANQTTAFTMPDGYWPVSTFNYTEMAAMTAGGAAYLLISPSGDVIPLNTTSSTVTTWVSLEGASFRHR
jgi:hypothetical protein